MRYLAALAQAVGAAIGSFFGLVFVWAVIEAVARHPLLPPGPTRLDGFVVLEVISLGVGLAVGSRAARRRPRAAANRAMPEAAGREVTAASEALRAQLPRQDTAFAGMAKFAAASRHVQEARQAADAAEAVTETVTVVLRRQIPPRFGEPPRSWLGGLPMLPDDVAWPRSVSSEYPDRGARPLHFVAQICAADLPLGLWAGLGPRQGWLLLFIDPNQGCPEGPDAFRILHTETLGSERAPPADLGPVHDGVYIAWDYGHCGDEASVPRVWRRWPVDLVTMANEASVEGRGVRVGPPDLASLLYAGAQVAGPAVRLTPPAPFTLRGALYTVNAALHKLGKRGAPRPLPNDVVARLQEPGCLDHLRTNMETQRDNQRQALAERQADGIAPSVRAVMEGVIARLDAKLDFLSRHATPADVIAYLHDAQARASAWTADGRARLERLRAALQARDLDATLTAVEWTELQADAAGDPYRAIRARAWNANLKDADSVPNIALDDDERHLAVAPGNGMLELVADYYVDPARRELIPGHLLADFEAFWRRLRSNRPHRMGGYHDGVQSTAQIGPTAHLLLFQIASDEAMHWCWGDVGAYYIFIRPADLRRGDFGAASMVLECH
jgi:uncharacterized protein YwqG